MLNAYSAFFPVAVEGGAVLCCAVPRSHVERAAVIIKGWGSGVHAAVGLPLEYTGTVL